MTLNSAVRQQDYDRMRNTSSDATAVRTVASRAAAAVRLPACDVPERPLDELLPAEAPGRRAAAAAGTGRAGPRAALRQSVDAEHVGRHALLSARLVHDEVQPQAERAAGGAAGHGRPASLSAGRHAARACWNCSIELQEMLAEIAGLPAVSLQPAAGAHGELTALLVAAAYFRDRGEQRTDGARSPTAPTAPTRPAPRWPASTP